MDTSKNLYSAARSEQTAESGGFTRVEERGEQAGMMFGPLRTLPVLRHLGYDYAQAITRDPVPVRVTMHRVMPNDEAGRVFTDLTRHCGLGGAPDDVVYAFHRGILLAHAKNSASVIQPDRALVQIDNVRPINFYLDVIAFLGKDARRFFRAFADLTREVLREVIRDARAGNEIAVEDLGDIQWVARDRGLARYPDLIADGADACKSLTEAEHVAVRQSKASIFVGLENNVDLVNVYRAQSASRSSRPEIQAFNPTQATGSGPGPDY